MVLSLVMTSLYSYIINTFFCFVPYPIWCILNVAWYIILYISVATSIHWHHSFTGNSELIHVLLSMFSIVWIWLHFQSCRKILFIFLVFHLNLFLCLILVYLVSLVASKIILLCYNDNECRLFAYKYDIFHSHSNLRHVKAYVVKLVSTSTSVPLPSTYHFFHLHFIKNHTS